MLFGISPKMPPQSYKTYAVLRPRATHTRVAFCQEVECRAFANGWKTIVDVSTHLGQKQAYYIRMHSGRSFTFTEGYYRTDSGKRIDTPGLVYFMFSGGQKCFNEHRIAVEREPLFRIKDGDWRGNPRGTPVLRLGARSWLDDFGEHQNRLADQARRG